MNSQPEEVFLYRLAAELGIWDVEGWKQEITLEQLRRWIAFYRIEPFGNDWRRTARAAVSISAAFGAKVDETTEEKFLPTYREEEHVQTEDEIRAELMKIPAFREQILAQQETD
jgi:hypothetical protein